MFAWQQASYSPFKLSVTSAVFSWRTAMNSSLKENKLTKTLFNLYCYILGKGKIKPLNICIKPDFINPGFLPIRKKKWLGMYNKKERPGSIIIVSSCTVVQK